MSRNLFYALVTISCLFVTLSVAKLDGNPRKSYARKSLNDPHHSVHNPKRRIKDLDSVKPGVTLASVKPAKAAIKYMEHLFDEISGSGGFNESKGNVIRSFAPKFGKDNRFLNFDFGAIKPKETVLRAEIYYQVKSTRFRKRYFMPKASAKKSRFFCYIMTQDGHYRMLQTPKLPSLEWLVFDVANIINSEKSRRKSLMGLSCGRKKRAGALLYSAKKMMKKNNPFMLVFSKNNKNPEEADSLPDFFDAASLETNEITAQPLNRRVKRRSPVKVTFENRFRNYLNSPMSAKMKWWKMFGGKKPRSSPKKKERVIPRTWYESEPLTNALHVDAASGYSWAGSATRGGGGQPDANNDSEAAVVLLKQDRPEPPPCQLKEMIIDFRDIGWDSWIIKPKTFKAHYCMGSCSVKLGSSGELKQTNHAILQNIVHAMRLQKDVPSACCAPEKMDSLTLLYFTKDNNVVLKNYPKMLVTSCACL